MRIESEEPKLLSTPDPSTDRPFRGIDSVHMQRAALYARVSSEKQKQEQTIDSQLAELRRQIAAAGHILVKEYIDDGYSGAYLDRPALDELRAERKTDSFDVIYFLSADRIAREQNHQNIIVSELLNSKKRIVIGGKDYEENPENTLTLMVLGAVAQFERAKITERMTRGRMHRLRMGVAISGFKIYGYDYTPKTATTPGRFTINEEQAAVVRWIFEMYGNGIMGLAPISRRLELSKTPTFLGKHTWHVDRLKLMLTNTTYTGTRFCNQTTNVVEPSIDGAKEKRVRRDREEWIPVPLPAIIPVELFEKAQARLKASRERYRQPPKRYLLSGMVQCGVCGRSYCSSRGYEKQRNAHGMHVSHFAQYRCNTTMHIAAHDLRRRQCRNSRIVTHLLEEKVFELVSSVLLDPDELDRQIIPCEIQPDRQTAEELGKITRRLGEIERERRRLIEQYANGRLVEVQYVAANRSLDAEAERHTVRKIELGRSAGATGNFELVGRSVRQFCANARLQFEASSDFALKRKFLADHIERIIFDLGRVSLVGTVPSADGNEGAALRFRIEGEIDRTAALLKRARKAVETRRANAAARVPYQAASL